MASAEFVTMARNQAVMSQWRQKSGLKNELQIRKWQWLVRIVFIIHRESQEMAIEQGMAMRKMSYGSLEKSPE